MERAAVKEFLSVDDPSKADPNAPRDPESLAAFQRLPAAKQRDEAFELMRRAEITLEHTKVVQEHKEAVPGSEKFEGTACPQEVTNAARTSFGVTMP
jgi:hypothetical protein